MERNSFLNLILAVVLFGLFSLFVLGCGLQVHSVRPNSSPNVSYEASEEGSVVEFTVPLRSSRMRFSGGSAPVFTSAWVEITDGEGEKSIKTLEIKEDGGDLVAYGKFPLPQGLYTAQVVAENADGTVRFASDQIDFEVRSGEITKISVNMRRVETETESGVVEVENITWTWTVPWDFPAIQSAIDYAESGDTVLVDGGTYAENLVMKEGMSLIAVEDSGATIDCASGSLRGAENSAIKGFIIRGNKNIWNIGVIAYAGMEISGNLITSFPDAEILVQNYTGAPINIHHNVIAGIGSFCKGIKIAAYEDGSDIRIFHNTFLNNMRSVSFEPYYYDGKPSEQKAVCSIYNNISVGDDRVVVVEQSEQLRDLIDISIVSNIYYGWCHDCYGEDVDYGPFMESCDNCGIYNERTFEADSSNVELDPMLDGNFVPQNPEVCGMFDGVTPGARDCAKPPVDDLNGKLVKMAEWPEGQGWQTIYYIFNNKRYIIPDTVGYHSYQYAIIDSWGWNKDDVITISQERLESMSLGYNITVRPGTYLLKIEGDSKVYAVEYCDCLRHITEAALPLIYGDNWQERVLVVPDVFFANYSISSEIIDARMETVPISTGILVPTDFPVGSIIDTTSAWIGDGGESGFLIGKIGARKLTEEGIEANGFNRKFFINGFGFNRPVAENNPITAHLPELDFLSNYVNVDTIDDINGGLGENGQSVSYCWYNGLPRNVKVGDTLEFAYDDGSISRKSSAVMTLHPEGWESFCEVPWGMSLPNYTARQNYTIRVH